jgi:hypothetical protein
MDPNFWGSSCWRFLHTITLDPRCKSQQCESQKQLLILLKKILPCPKCRRSYQEFTRGALDDCDAKNVGKFICELHHLVNAKLGKTSTLIRPAEEWAQYYADKCTIDGWNAYLDDMFYFLFTLAFNYPEDFAHSSRIAAAYAEFFNLLPKAIPSEKFQQCLELQMKLHPLEGEDGSGAILRTRQTLITWLYEIYKACVPPSQQQPLDKITEAMEGARSAPSKPL